ncbi:MAG: hypothetical protein IH847_08825 [Acidobacteria bacterium]|nr:hypothetical protein [Acidobacteriota bacterium]
MAPATGRLCRLSTRRQVPAYRRQAAGLSGKINIVKVTHSRPPHGGSSGEESDSVFAGSLQRLRFSGTLRESPA